MTISAQLADGTPLEFPDGTDPAVIQKTVKRLIAQNSAKPAATPTQTEDPGIVGSMVIGAGRTGDKLFQGVKQLGLSALVAAKEGTGIGDPKENLQALARMKTEQAGNDSAYANLAALRPFSTGMGEALPSLAIPMGQATAVGRIAAPAFGMAGLGAASYGSPQERAFEALKQGALGTAGGATAEVASRFISPTKSFLSATQQRNVENAAKNIGFTPLPSQLTGNQNIALIEDMLARSPGSSGVMQDFARKNADAINSRAGQAIKAQMSPGEGLTQDVLKQASDRIGNEYNVLQGRSTMPVTSDVIDAVTNAQKNLSIGASEGKGSALSELTRLKDELYGKSAFDGKTLQTWVSDLKSMARGTQNNKVASELSSVAKTMEVAGQGADHPAWQALNKQNASFETLMKPGVLNSITGDISPVKLGNVMNNQFGKTFATGKLDGALMDVAALGKALPPMRSGSQTFERQAASSPMAWLMSLPKYAAAKAVTSEGARDYLAKGLLANPEQSALIAQLAKYGLLPAGIVGGEQLGPYALGGLLNSLTNTGQR